MTFTQAQVSECNCLYNSINQGDNLKKCILILWVTQRRRDKLSGYLKYFRKLPDPVIRDMYGFILQRFGVGNYYNIMDNYSYYKLNETAYNYARKEDNIWFSTRPNTYIGKILDKKLTKISIPGLCVKNIVEYLDRKALAPFLIFGFKNITKTTYNISYLDWGEPFNEYVSRKQINLIDKTSVEYLFNLRIGSFLDCCHPETLKYYRGMVTHIYHHHDKIIGTDVIMKYRGTESYYIYMRAVPIFSSDTVMKNLHVRDEYNYCIPLRHTLSWAYITFKKNENKYYGGTNTLINFVEVIKHIHVGFTFTDIVTGCEIQNLTIYGESPYYEMKRGRVNALLTRRGRAIDLMAFVEVPSSI